MSNCGHSHVDAVNRRDPTGTTGIRKGFEADMARRFRRVKALITQSLVENDALGLKSKLMDQALAPRQFQFSRSADKVAAFMTWLSDEQNEIITGVRLGTPMQSAASGAWSNVYIEASYQKGIRDAGAQLRRAGAKVAPSWVEQAFTRPIHADRAGLAFTRTFTELRGITEAMDQQVSRVLAQGLAAGDGPFKIARDINERVDKIGITRARTLARTEVISAHAEATLNSFQEAGIEGVKVLSEFSTTGDGLVCPECDALNEKTYTLAQAHGVIPVHPNCRCAWLPVVEGGTGIELI